MTLRRTAFLAFALLALPLVGGCSSSSTPPASGPAAHLWVTDCTANAIYGYPLTATGSATPLVTIQGGSTTLSCPHGIALDSAGNIYVANLSGASALEFAVGSNGNVAPIKTLSGASTGFVAPRGIAVDSSGNVYVSDTTAKAVFIFTAAQTGNVTPNSKIQGASTTLAFPGGVAVDSAGKVYVGDQTDAAILEWTTGHVGNVAPDNTITGVSGSYGLMIASNGDIVIGNQGGPNAIEVFAGNATGAAVPLQNINGASTGLSNTRGAAMDSAGNTYAADGGVPIFAPAATGNVAPTTRLTVPTDSRGVALH